MLAIIYTFEWKFQKGMLEVRIPNWKGIWVLSAVPKIISKIVLKLHAFSRRYHSVLLSETCVMISCSEDVDPVDHEIFSQTPLIHRRHLFALSPSHRTWSNGSGFGKERNQIRNEDWRKRKRGSQSDFHRMLLICITGQNIEGVDQFAYLGSVERRVEIVLHHCSLRAVIWEQHI